MSKITNQIVCMWKDDSKRKKFSKGHLRSICHQLNVRILKWVKWEKGKYKYDALNWLRGKFKSNPQLFPHWLLVNP